MPLSRWIVPAAALLPLTSAAEEQKPTTWAQLPRMELERQFAGPLQDTLIQRWRDPVDGTVCYVYLPITVQHSAPNAAGFVQYGANAIGSISCTPGGAPTRSPKAPRRPRSAPPSPTAK